MTYEKIVWISIDTLRSDCINTNKSKLYKQEYKLTTKLEKSKLDELCSKGCFFPNTITAAPYTSASHAAYFTGLWPKNNGVYDSFNSKMNPSVQSIFQIAKKQNYTTLFKTDFPFVLGKDLGVTKGVDNYYVEDNKKILQEIKNQKKVFAFIHFGLVHYPYGFHNIKFGGQDYKRKVSELLKKYNLPFKKNKLDDTMVESVRSKKDLNLLLKYKSVIDYLYKSKKYDDLFNLYLEGINRFHKKYFNFFLDDLLRILKKENYLIIISSDHGEAWNDESFGHYNSLNEGVLRVPVLFLAKDIGPRYYDNRIRTIDIAPTLNRILLNSTEKFDGLDLNPIIYGKESFEDGLAFSTIWLSEAKDILSNIAKIINGKSFKTKNKMSEKYAAVVYHEKYKYVLNYKNIVEGILKTQAKEKFTDKLFEIDSKKNICLSSKVGIKKNLRKKLIKYNVIFTKSSRKIKKNLKEYFRVLGYQIQ
ncbi:MAG: sulfatase-like hydrolase/transferase [archaeon]